MVENYRLDDVVKGLNKILSFTNQHAQGAEYINSSAVKFGKSICLDLISRIEKTPEMNKEDWVFIEDGISSLIRGYENIFKVFELSVEFNNLMEDLYKVKIETDKLFS